MKNKVLSALLVLFLGLGACSVCTDDYGEFDTPVSVDHAFYRIGRDLRGGAGEVAGEIKETNENMQGVVDGRRRRNDRRIARDGVDTP